MNKLIRDYDGLPAFPSGPIACPLDNGSQIDALIAYRSGKKVTVQLGLTGCNGVTNGDLIRTAAGTGSPPGYGQKLIRLLERLTPG